MVGARNFGGGSSREAAVYALYDYGVRCVIAPSFGDIFSGNAVQNGLLTAVVTDEDAAEIMEALDRTPELPLTVDLEEQTIVCGNRTYTFSIDPVRRMRLLNGWDDIALTESYRDRIASFKTAGPGRAGLGDPRTDRMSRTRGRHRRRRAGRTDGGAAARQQGHRGHGAGGRAGDLRGAARFDVPSADARHAPARSTWNRRP